jgi:predicted dehydrogenase
MSQQPIRIAIVGAGIFAREAHVPAIRALGETFEVVAVCSRTRASAELLARQIGDHVDVETDLDALLARKDVDAVDIVMPIDKMPSAISSVLQSGKHLISEKPIAPDVAEGMELIQAHRGGVWMVAENMRYDAAVEQAAAMVARGDIGTIMLSSWTIANVMRPSNRYYNTAWRRSGDFPGGFLLDGGVHQAAMMRRIVGEITTIRSDVRQARTDLPPADTLTASIRYASGALGTFALTYTAAESYDSGLIAYGERGTLRVADKTVELTRDGKTETQEFPENGVEREFTAFAAAIRGEAHLNSPAQALQDLAVIEAMLQSAQRNEPVTLPRIEGL